MFTLCKRLYDALALVRALMNADDNTADDTNTAPPRTSYGSLQPSQLEVSDDSNTADNQEQQTHSRSELEWLGKGQIFFFVYESFGVELPSHYIYET